MNSYIVHKYIHLCALEGLKEKNGNYTFRCPICGDSKKSKSKRRGWVLTKDNGNMVTYVCHNCGVTTSFANFLKQHKPFLYADFKKEAFFEKVKHRKPIDTEIKIKNSGYDSLKKAVERSATKSILKKLDPLTDEALKVCLDRKLPEEFVQELFYSPNFLKFAKDNELKDIKRFPDADPRIIIPFYDQGGSLIYLQGRALNKEDNLRYVTIKLIEDSPKIWGMDRVNKEEMIFITEGVLDAVFLDNGVAMAGGQSDIQALISNYGVQNLCMVYDRDMETNKDIRKFATKMVNKGLSLFFWDEVKKKKIKDLNDLIIDGCSVKALNKMVRRNIYKGIEAKVKLKVMR